jgi:SHS family sialic acid transporter-like MFS transporter
MRGGAVAPLAGAAIAESFGSLGSALTTLAVSLTVVVALIIGFDVPARIGRAIGISPDHSAGSAGSSEDRTAHA